MAFQPLKLEQDSLPPVTKEDLAKAQITLGRVESVLDPAGNISADAGPFTKMRMWLLRSGERIYDAFCGYLGQAVRGPHDT